MKDIIEPVDTDDGLFHDGDPSTGAEGTIVYAKIMNALQGGLISTQSEIKTILAEAGFKPDASSENQLLAALKKIFITENSGIVKNALQKDNNLSDVVDKTKALENIKGVPDSRKINGHPLTGDTNITAQDIFNGQAIGLSTEDLDTLKTPGIYYQPANANTSAARHYPETNAGTLLVYKNAGVTQVYIVYNSSRTYTRSQYSTGSWTAWAKQYDTANKPNSDDVNCISRDGTHVGGFANGDAARPYMRHTASNAVVELAKKGDSYTKAESDTGYMPRTGAYTKAESDGRFQPKGSYTPAGQAYTKAESNARYVQGIQLGARARHESTNATSNPFYLPAGCFFCGYGCPNSDANNGYWFYKPIQRNINGTWVTISG